MNCSPPDEPVEVTVAPATEPPASSTEQAAPSTEPAARATERELGGRGGLEPTRYGDWELRGRCIDF